MFLRGEPTAEVELTNLYAQDKICPFLDDSVFLTVLEKFETMRAL